MKTVGIHHITAIVGHPQENMNFYRDILGLRFVKKTVNFDDPTTYHFYFGDDRGSPGTIITFFPWPHSSSGRRGGGQVGTTMYMIPQGSMDYWHKRIEEHGITTHVVQYFNQLHLSFEDPHGLLIELVEQQLDVVTDRIPNAIPNRYRIQGFYGARLLSTNYQATARTLTELMGYTLIGEDGKIRRYQSTASHGSIIDLVLENVPQGTLGVGTVHHIAFRTSSTKQQLEWQTTVNRYGLMATAVRDRNYFTSIYFREPGGILYEIATDGPGFTVDEPLESLGQNLKLPAQYEQYRSYIESKLIPLHEQE